MRKKFLSLLILVCADTFAMEIEMNLDAQIEYNELYSKIVDCSIIDEENDYIKKNIDNLNTVINLGVGVAPCARIILGVYYLRNGKETEAEILLTDGCNDKYEGYYYALQYLDDSIIEQNGLADYSETNAKLLLKCLLSSYQSKAASSKKEIYGKPPRKIYSLEEDDKKPKKLAKEDQTLLQNTKKELSIKDKSQKRMENQKLKDPAAGKAMEMIDEN